MEKGFITSLIVLFFVITSCTDNNKVAEENFEPDLTGSWNRTDDQAEGNIVSTYTFKSNSSYIYRIDWFGFNGEPKTELTSSSESTGVFKVEGDSLFFQNLNYGSGLNSKFWIEGNVLHLEYISYPADAPVLTQVKYNRID